MKKFCEKCGCELEENAKFCSHCGASCIKEEKKIEGKSKDHNTYFKVSSIVMLCLSGLIIFGGLMDTTIVNPVIVFHIPGLIGLTAGILCLCRKDTNNFVLISGFLYFAALLINSIGISDISFYGIGCIVFGILNIVFSKRKEQ